MIAFLPFGKTWFRIVLAVMIAVAALVVRFMVLPISAGLAFLTFYPATAITALWLGAVPAMLVTILGAILGPYFFMGPYGAFKFDLQTAIAMFIFGGSGIIMSLLARQKERLLIKLQDVVADSKEKEQKLAQQLQEIEHIYTHAPIGMCLIDRDFRYVRVNKRLADQHGIPIEEHMGRSIYEVLPASLSEQVGALYKKVFKTGVMMHDVEVSANMGEGTRTWISNFFPIRSVQENQVTRLGVAVQEITHSKQLEEALRNSEQEARLQERKVLQQLREIENLYTHTPVGMCMMDHNYRYIRINKQLADINGASIEHHIGRTIYDVLPPALAQEIEAYYKPVFETGEPNNNIEVSADTPDGERTWLAHFIPLKSTTDALVTQLIAVVQEVTAYKRLERALRTSERKAKYEERRFRDIAESTAEMFWEFDENGRFTYFLSKDIPDNSHMIGKSVQEIFLHTQEDYTINKDAWGIWEKAVQEKRPYSRLEFNVPHQEGREIFSVSGVPMFNDEGCYCGYRGSSSIVTAKYRETELLRAKAMAEAANIAKSEFLATMSHEIRTPMNAIVGLTELALDQEMSQKLRSYLVKIIASSRSLLRLINDILDFSKIEAGKVAFEMSEFFLRDVFSSLGNTFREKCIEKSLELVLCMSQECGYRLYGDPLRLEQVLMNLLGNAIKFTEKGEVEVQVRTTHESLQQMTLEFSVRDTGFGMTEEALKEIFTPFMQADTSITRRFGGTGLGLAISNKLVGLMGGRMWVRSQPGQGSTFFFTVDMQRRVDTEVHDLIPPEEMARLKVLVVEDNDAARNALERILRVFQCVVTAVSTEHQAIHAIKSGVTEGVPYQLLFMDHFLCGTNGIETIRRIREVLPVVLAPKVVLLVNSDPDEELYTIGDSVGVNGYLTKPVGCSLLFDTMMDIFGKEVTHSIGDHRMERINPTEIAERIGGARVLLAEDNVINQQVAVEILEKIGLSVDIANNGIEAAIQVTQERYDVVLMDIHMPQMDGYQATRQIRKDPKSQRLPILAMTANAMVGDREKCLRTGMNDHIAKPITRSDLYAKLIKWILPREGLGLAFCSSGDQRPSTETLRILPTKLTGIHIEIALDRLNGNSDLYHSLLSAFHRDFATSGEQMRTLLLGKRKNDIENATILSHTIKGLAGNMAATRLFDAAAALEQCLLSSPAERLTAFVPFEHALNEVIASVGSMNHVQQAEAQTHATVSAAESKPSQDEQPFDLKEVSTQMIELSALLTQKAYKARAVFENLKPSLLRAPIDVHNELQHLEECIQRIEFKHAHAILSIMANKLFIDLQGTKT